MTTTIPEGVKSNGHVPVYFFPSGTITNITAPTVAQVTGAGVIKLDCYFVEGNPVVNKTSQTTEMRRMCLKKAATKPGAQTYTLQLTGVYDGQNRTPTENQLYNALKEGVEGVIGIAWGHDSDDPLVAGVIADLIKGEVGTVTKNTPVWDEDLTITVDWLGEVWEEDVAVVA